MRSSTRAGAGGLAAATTLALILQCTPAFADDGDAPPGPDPDVARISVAQGDVEVRRADSGDTFAAAINAPVSEGDYLTTQDDSRGEVEFDYGAAVRVAPDTQLRFTVLQPDHHQLQLAQGTVELRVFRGLAAHPEVETPSATIHPDGNGSFRISVTDDGNTLVTARSGRVDVETSGGTQTLAPGPTLLVTGSADDARVQTVETVAFDGFDSFNRSRDARVERASDWAYVDAGFVGADDLDGYGTWSNVDGYGQVWQPTNVPDGWSPYSTGRWVWQPYYGWAWVDTAPWGYAPYHYGRWFYANAGWYWAPGIDVAGPVAYSAPVVVFPRPVFYRPALVAFFSFGGGGGGGLGIGFGNVGWCALAPSEPFRPWYGGGYARGGVNNVTDITNVTNVTNVTNNYGNTYVNNGNITRTYRNLNAPGGAIAVNNGNFANGNFSHIVKLQRSELANATPVRGVVPVVPTKSNLAFSGRAVEPIASRAPEPRFTRFATKPETPVVSFAEQQRAVQREAVKTYPEHAAILAQPEAVKALDRPGLITRENVPEAFKPVAPVRAGADAGTPPRAGLPGEAANERGTYGQASSLRAAPAGSDAAAEPAETRTTYGEQTIKRDSVEKTPVDKAPVERVPYERAPVESSPAERAPAEREPAERMPSERAPVEHEPAYHAPSEHLPSYATRPVVRRPAGVDHPAASHPARSAPRPHATDHAER